MLIPNSSGEEINWSDRLQNPSDWIILSKRDGIRLEITEDSVKGRSLKPVKNKQILHMAKTLQNYIKGKGLIIEAEFYAHDMTFPEIAHFFKTEDICSYKTRTKYEKLWKKTQGDPEQGWTYPGRDVKWLTSWNKELRFHLFDVIVDKPAMERLALANTYAQVSSTCAFGPYEFFNTVDKIQEYYNDVLNDGYEGLVLMHKEGKYKNGRATIKENIIYKMKEDSLEFDGQIIDLVQATTVDPTVATTTNELGRTVTSKKKGDRILIEAISGFLVKMDDGRTLTVSLRGWNDDRKQTAWLDGSDKYIGQWIKFTGMKPVKVGGAVRHAQFKCFRDSK